MIITADFMEAEAAISGPMKVKILSYIFEVVANYEKQIEKAEVCAHVVKSILEKSINFLADRRKIPNLPPNDSKI
jgi:hypothetical protein